MKQKLNSRTKCGSNKSILRLPDLIPAEAAAQGKVYLALESAATKRRLHTSRCRGHVGRCVRESVAERNTERLHRGKRDQSNQNQQQCIFSETLSCFLAIQPEYKFLHVAFSSFRFRNYGLMHHSDQGRTAPEIGRIGEGALRGDQKSCAPSRTRDR
jgi:hypothetical protein